MTTIPQRLRDIAVDVGQQNMAAYVKLRAIAAELEVHTADVVPVVAVMTSYARSNELNFWTREAASLPTGEYRLVTEAAHLATVAALQARINALEARQWQPLTDEDRTRALQSLPDMLDGFMKTWGWLHFAKAIEAICREKNAQQDTSKEQP